MNQAYLGDGVYARFDRIVPGDVTLTTEDGVQTTHEIYLEPQTILNLLLHLKTLVKNRS